MLFSSIKERINIYSEKLIYIQLSRVVMLITTKTSESYHAILNNIKLKRYNVTQLA